VQTGGFFFECGNAGKELNAVMNRHLDSLRPAPNYFKVNLLKLPLFPPTLWLLQWVPLTITTIGIVKSVWLYCNDNHIINNVVKILIKITES